MGVVEKESIRELTVIPKHIAIIMDGNNRWAKDRGLPGAEGHKAGVLSLREVVRTCGDYDEIEALTVFAFSSENWQRPTEEVDAIMSLLLNALIEEIPELNENGVRFKIIGDRSRFSEKLQRQMATAEQLTENNSRMTLNVAANYGGQWDIVNACRQLAEQVQQGDLRPDQITEADFNQLVQLSEFPPPDLCIRTADERRVSNFLLWQIAYAELYFCSAYWPDFGRDEFLLALEDYASRQRRFGGR